MNHFLQTSAAIAVLGLCATSSFAQEANFSKGYFSFEYGTVKFKDQQSIASALVNAVGGTATSVQDTGTTVGRIFGGMNFTENVGAELGYIIAGTANASFSGVSRTAVAYSGSLTQKTSGFDYSALVRPSINTGYNGLFVRLGGHTISNTTEVTIVTGSSLGITGSTTSGTGSLIGVGYDGKINNQLDYRIAYTAYNSIAGVSGNDITYLSFGLIAKF